MVGCVLVRGDRCIGQGYHRCFGGPHAEIEALRSLSPGDDAQGATAYVTLEPCCHHGKTPPCSDALIAAKVRRVVIAMRDPFPRVDGGGISRLEAAGIDVALEESCRPAAEQLNAPYLKRLRQGRPWVIAKWAMTADGRVATHSGQSKWISSPQSRQHVHRLRGRVDAILAGVGTVIADDPMLNARLPQTETSREATEAPAVPPRVAKRIVVCHQRLPPIDAKLFRTADQWPTWLFVSPHISPRALDEFTARGAEVIRGTSGAPQRMIAELLDALGQRQMTNVMVEGGPQLLGSFLGTSAEQCLLDECHVYVGPKLFGGQQALGPLGGTGIAAVSQAVPLALHQCDRFGDDVRLIYRRQPPTP
jgi:diaminohydroxyphosphoribosylaminopyrimidine deaminase/5-amino-6-(5-phosphoribosylamino)uracil reductase